MSVAAAGEQSRSAACRVAELAFARALDGFLQSGTARAITSGKLSVAQYASLLREVYHYTRDNPQKQAAIVQRFRGQARSLVKPFLLHAASEVGHDLLALDDLTALGLRREEALNSGPLPETAAFIAFGFYQIEHRPLVSYFGNVYFLEHLPTSIGKSMSGGLSNCGIDMRAQSFLSEHTSADVGHNRLMDLYLETLCGSDSDLEELAWSIETTGHLYARMFDAAVGRPERPVLSSAGAAELWR